MEGFVKKDVRFHPFSDSQWQILETIMSIATWFSFLLLF